MNNGHVKLMIRHEHKKNRKFKFDSINLTVSLMQSLSFAQIRQGEDNLRERERERQGEDNL